MATDTVTRTEIARRCGAVTALASAAILVAGCSAPDEAVDPSPTQETGQPVALAANVDDDAADVTVDTVVTIEAEHGQVISATIVGRGPDGKDEVAGRVSGGSWIATQRLEPGTTYTIEAVGTGENGADQKLSSSFTTEQLALSQQTYPAVAPLEGETVGVGMPVIVSFDIPVENKALFERNMHVSVDDEDVTGSWSWLSDRVVHYRPQHYWPAGTDVHVSLKVNGLPAGGGIYGQQDQEVDFAIGRKAVSVVDVAAHRLTYKVDGKAVRTIPVTTGDSTHRTRKGTKIIMEKFASVDMDAASTGVDADAPDYYNIEGVKWAMRLTNSGEFLHAAPWSVGSQGVANVSHGCTGMSTANAGWLYHHSRRGDVVKFVNSPRGLEDNNGWTDWNTSWKAWREGSALYRDDDEPAPNSDSTASSTSA
jgi:lipoprotein-anchoring transpeptidase ErfK/SrfK